MHGEIIAGKIVKIKPENISVKSIYIKPMKRIKKPRPGQFFMIWVPKYEEVPMSVSGFYDGIIRISVSAVGETTRAMHKMQKNMFLGLKGPLGNGLDIMSKRYLLVGGGYGVAPLIYAMHEIKRKNGEAVMIIGARTKDLILFEDEAKKYGEVYISTDDGSEGYKGTAADLAKEIIKKQKFDEVLVCGPKPLMIKVASACIKKEIKCQVLAEEHMKCGIGLCGSCAIGDGFLVCRDGPVIDAAKYIGYISENAGYFDRKEKELDYIALR